MRQFIVNTSLDKPDAATQRLIRSHVMRGKNRRNKRIPGLFITDGRTHERREASEAGSSNAAAASSRLGPLTRLAGSNFALTRFASDMEPYMLDLVFKCMPDRLQVPHPFSACAPTAPAAA